MKKSELINLLRESLIPDIRKVVREELEYIIKKSDQIDETTRTKSNDQFKSVLNKQKKLLDESFNPNKRISKEYANAPEYIQNAVNKDYSKMFAKK